MPKETTAKIETLLLSLIKALVDHPDDVYIKATTSLSTIVLEIQVEKSDIGKIIGKNGKMIVALREIFASIASKKKLRIHMEIIE